MRMGFAILAHQRLDRAAALARYLADHGAPVAVHLDRRVADAGPLAGLPGVSLLRTRHADWGRFGLVEATLDCIDVLLGGPAVDHVVLLSGACLPVRPLAELAAMLAGHPDKDFIESVPVTFDGWVQGGLSIERFTLYHLFSWHRQRRLFDVSVSVQRALGVRRRLPEGLAPHLGLQWWCLSAQTLRALRSDPRLPAWRRFFRRSWIPDEGFFQTIVGALRPGAEVGPPLHLARFNRHGVPFAFHDDHADLLARSGAWFARKIDPDANGLYRRFLGGGVAPETDPGIAEAAFRAATRRQQEEGRGTLSAARFPHGTGQAAVATVAPYLAILADDPAPACASLAGNPTLAVHGQLFGPGTPSFAGGASLNQGNLPAATAVRTYRPAQFLALTVRADRAAGRRTVLGYSPAFRASALRRRPGGWHPIIGRQLAGDPNARLVILGDPDQMLGQLRGAGAGTPPPLRAWWTVVEAPGIGSNRLAAIAASDWTNPAGWTVPADPHGGWPE